MPYFNYHAKIKRLISDGKLERIEFVERWKNISPAMVLFFKECPPMPIRDYRFSEYVTYLNGYSYAKALLCAACAVDDGERKK